MGIFFGPQIFKYFWVYLIILIFFFFFYLFIFLFFIFFFFGGGGSTVDAGSKPMYEEKMRVPPWGVFGYRFILLL